LHSIRAHLTASLPPLRGDAPLTMIIHPPDRAHTFVPVPINVSVANDSLGFINETDQRLQFQLLVNDATQVVTLQPRQITVINVGAATQLKGTIGSGASDSVSSFTAGRLYAVRAEGDHWVFARTP
jgi:hypothetical protein